MKIQISGQGKNIIFLHGYCESLNIWDHFEKALSKDYQVVLIDLPGHGRSDWTLEESTLEAAANDIHKTLGDHGIYEYFLIGHSLGGYISLAIAELFSHSVTGLGLINSTTFADAEEKKSTRDKLIRYIEKHGVASFTNNFVPTLFAPDSRKKYESEIKILKEQAAKTSLEGAIGFAEAMKARPDRTHILVTSDKPTFIIAGDQDPAVPIHETELMKSKIKKGQSKILSNSGHLAFIEAKKESLEFIEAFLNQNFV